MGGFNIPLAVQPPPQNPGPIDMAQGGLSVQRLINAVQLQKQQQAQNQIAQQQSQIELQQQQQTQKDQAIFNKAFHDANGDWNTAIQRATQDGASGGFITQAQIHRADQVAKLATADKDVLANEQARHDTLAKDANALLQIQDPNERAAEYAKLRNGHLTSGAYKPTDLPEQVPSEDELKSTVAQSKAVQDMMKDASDLREKNAKLPGEQAESAAKGYSTAAQTMAGANEQLGWTARRNLAVKNNPDLAPLIPEQYSPQAAEQVRQLGVAPKDLATVAPDKLELQDYLKKNPNKGPADFLAWKTGQESMARANADLTVLNALNKQSQNNGRTTAPGLTPDATDSAATTFHNTGQLPPIGRGAAGQAQRTAIMNREREMFPNTVLSANSAEFKSNGASLNAAQKNFDQVNAFENTAGKNLDIFLNQAQKAIDTGLPITNLPARMVAGKLGSENQAAFDTARTTALTEIAKVLSSANAGSGVVSDSARHEVEGLIKGDATLGQIMAAAKILKQDMQNRHDSYAEQISTIKNRMQQAGTPGGAGPVTATTETNKSSHPFFDQFGGQQRAQ